MDLEPRHYRLLSATFALFAIVALTDCKARCPPGRIKQGDVCVATQATTAGDGSGDAGMGDPQQRDGSVTGSRDDGLAAEKDASAAAVDASVSPNTSSQAGTSGTSAIGGGSASSPIDRCKNQSGQSVCDGSVMYRCDEVGATIGQEMCANEMYCLFGLSIGECAACNPGEFRCTGATLEKCSPEGQYGAPETCATEALCNASAGACTEMVCLPNEKTCASDGTLQLCNDDGSALTDLEMCGANMCDAQNKRCYVCIPNAASCSGDDVIQCGPDGLTMGSTSCTQGVDECLAGTCAAGGQCESMPKARGEPCSVGKCDGAGACLRCLDDTECRGAGECSEGVCSDGACESRPKMEGADCGLGKCDGRGRCAECIRDSECRPSGECFLARCENGMCNTTIPKSVTESCSGGRVCDGAGRCADCNARSERPTQRCGFCGSQTRTCNGGNWSDWGQCLNEGCSPGSTDTAGCPARESRVCGSNCMWGACECMSGEHKCDGQCVPDVSPVNCGQRCDPCPAPRGVGPGGAGQGVATCENGRCSFTCFNGTRCGGGCCPTPNECIGGRCM